MATASSLVAPVAARAAPPKTVSAATSEAAAMRAKQDVESRMARLRTIPTAQSIGFLRSTLTDPLAMLRESPTLSYRNVPSAGLFRGDEPGRIEPAVGLAVVGQPRDVPVADEGRVRFPNRGPAADIDHAVGEPGQDLGRVVRRADLANGPVLVGKGRDRGDRSGPGDDHVTARDLEEPRHVGDKFAPLAALPGKPALQPQLPALAYGAYGTNVSHALLLFDAAPVRHDLSRRWRF